MTEQFAATGPDERAAEHVPANPQLAAYMTSVALSLTITKQQMLAICRATDNCRRRSCKCDISTFVVTHGALYNKGLLTNHGVHLGWAPTKAGRLVHDLMIEAGLCVHQWDEPS